MYSIWVLNLDSYSIKIVKIEQNVFGYHWILLRVEISSFLNGIAWYCIGIALIIIAQSTTNGWKSLRMAYMDSTSFYSSNDRSSFRERNLRNFNSQGKVEVGHDFRI